MFGVEGNCCCVGIFFSLLSWHGNWFVLDLSEFMGHAGTIFCM